MRNFSDKSCRENQNKLFVFSNLFFENHAVYEKMWKHILERGRTHMTIWRLHITCWITKATHTHSQCEILIALPLQKWLHERASILRYTYYACLVKYTEFVYLHVIWVSLSLAVDVCGLVPLPLTVQTASIPPSIHSNYPLRSHTKLI